MSQNNRASWLRGPYVPCDFSPGKAKHPYRLVLLGAPGVGKGTQAELLCERLGCCHLSTGDIFRTAKDLSACQRSPAMNEALRYMKQGLLVPDETVLALVRERAMCLKCGGGFLLDGFPRTVGQAEALDALMRKLDVELDAVLDYRLAVDEIVMRLSGRRTCGKCKAVYNMVSRPAKVRGVCDHCGGELLQREDDREESVRVRLAEYETLTRPLTDWYAAKGLLLPIAAKGSAEEIFGLTLAALRATDRAAV